MVAANGSDIQNIGQKVIKFKGVESKFTGESEQVFARRT